MKGLAALMNKERKRKSGLAAEIAALRSAIVRLEEKVDRCDGFCEQILDEVVPLGLAIDAITADATITAD
jgi:hypothetical protein